MCVPQMPIRKKYSVTGSKHEFLSYEFDTQEEACTAVKQLVANGFSSITVRDIEKEGDIW